MQLHEWWMAWNLEVHRLCDEKTGIAAAVGLKTEIVKESKRERRRDAQGHTLGDYLCCVTQKIGLEMSHSFGTNLSMLSGVLRRLPTMLCGSVATPSVGVKFPHKTSARERMAAYYSHLVLMFPSQLLMDNITLSIDLCSAAVIMLYYPSLSICSDSDCKSK